jgi:hypothetical protein
LLLLFLINKLYPGNAKERVGIKSKRRNQRGAHTDNSSQEVELDSYCEQGSTVKKNSTCYLIIKKNPSTEY